MHHSTLTPPYSHPLTPTHSRSLLPYSQHTPTHSYSPPPLLLTPTNPTHLLTPTHSYPYSHLLPPYSLLLTPIHSYSLLLPPTHTTRSYTHLPTPTHSNPLLLTPTHPTHSYSLPHPTHSYCSVASNVASGDMHSKNERHAQASVQRSASRAKRDRHSLFKANAIPFARAQARSFVAWR